MKKRTLLLVGLVSLLFLFLRFYKLNTSLEFFGDVGRDLHELTLMLEEKKPTLLGPGISFLPLNQSPLYYYSLLPIFILSGRSPFTAMYTFSPLYLLFFLIGVYVFRKAEWQKNVILTVAFLVSLHPEFVHQLRNPWNPSFAPPFILGALITLLIMKKKFNKKLIITFTSFLSLALAMTVSITPVALTLLTYLLYKYRGQFKQSVFTLVSFFATLALVFSPVIIFEIRHDFFFLNRLSQDDPFLSNESIALFEKIYHLFEYLSGAYTPFWTVFICLTISLALLLNLFLIFRNKISKVKDQKFLLFLNLFCFSTLLTVAMPFVLHAHYVFGLLCLLFVSIALLRKKILFALLFVLLITWLHPKQSAKNFLAPRRSVMEMVSCMELTCSKLDKPVFVTAQAWHEYHSALEYTYLLNRAGCPARNIIQHPNFANQMIVVADNSTYQHGKTNFSELVIFGPSSEKEVIECSEKLSVHILEKN